MKFSGDPNYQLRRSKANPNVRRWQRVYGEKIVPITEVLSKSRFASLLDAKKLIGLDRVSVSIASRNKWEEVVRGIKESGYREERTFPFGDDAPVAYDMTTGTVYIREDVEEWIEKSRGEQPHGFPPDEDLEKTLMRVLLHPVLINTAYDKSASEPDLFTTGIHAARNLSRSGILTPRLELAAKTSDRIKAAALWSEALLLDPKVFRDLWKRADHEHSVANANVAIAATASAAGGIRNTAGAILMSQVATVSDDVARGLDKLTNVRFPVGQPKASEVGSDDHIERYLKKAKWLLGAVGESPADFGLRLGHDLRRMISATGTPLWKTSFVRDKSVQNLLSTLKRHNPEAYQILLSAPVTFVPRGGPLIRIISASSQLYHPDDNLYEGGVAWFLRHSSECDKEVCGSVVFAGGRSDFVDLGEVVVHELAHLWDEQTTGEDRLSRALGTAGYEARSDVLKDMQDASDYAKKLGVGELPVRALQYGSTTTREVPSTLSELIFVYPEAGREIFQRYDRLRQVMRIFWGFDPVQAIDEILGDR